ncbi:MAG: sigma factor G inhibitor Gin [Bacillota bacterium]|jgi:hypothetical protein
MTRRSAGCVICHRIARLEEALVLQGQVICANCEQAILTCAPEHPEYDLYTRGLKKIWRLLPA